MINFSEENTGVLTTPRPPQIKGKVAVCHWQEMMQRKTEFLDLLILTSLSNKIIFHTKKGEWTLIERI